MFVQKRVKLIKLHTWFVDSGPLSQRSAITEQYAQTKTNTLTLTDTGGAVLTLML